MKSDTTFGASGYASADIHIFRDAVDIDKSIADFPVFQFAAGETVPAIVDGDAILYVVLMGALKVSMHVAHTDVAGATPEVGREVLPGDCVGEFSVLGGERRGVSISATQHSDVLVIDAAGLWKLIDESSGFARKLLALRSSGARAFYPQFGGQELLGKHHSMIDSGSGLQNRAWLDEHLVSMTNEAQETNTPFSMLMISLDYADSFIDSYGHLAEEEVLRMTCRVIVDSLRPTDFAVRYGDNELAVLLPDASVQGANMVAQRLSECMKKTVVFADMREPLPHITASFGVACLDPKQTERDLVGASIDALDRAKRAGKSVVST
jgi:diguanylate cyclase